MTNRDDRETAIGGSQRGFPSTCWSRITESIGGEDRHSGLEELARRYWKPIYTYIRLTWAKTPEDAKDLTQDFFAYMIDTEFLARADPARGRFRSFVKVALKHFLVHDRRDASTLKRGGGQAPLSLDWDAAILNAVPEAAGRSPEDLLDDAWKNTLLTDAEAALKEELRRSDRDVTFAVFRDFYLSESEQLDYRAVAARHGIAEDEVNNHLRYAKNRYRDILRELVSETVGSESDLLDEWGALFAAIDE